MDSTKKYENPSPEITTNFLSRLFFCWVLPFLKYGYKHGLQLKDIYNTTESDLSGPLGDNLEKNWNLEIEKSRFNNKKPSLKRAIFKTFGKSYSVYGIYIFVQVIILRTIHPIILAEYIKYYEASSKAGTKIGWLLASAVILISFFNTLIYHHCCMGCQRIGMRVRIASCSLVYRKLLKLSQTSLGQTAAGQLVNLLSNDVQRFDIASNFLHYLWIMPIQCATGFYVMYRSVGVAAFAGMIAMALEAIPLQGYLSKLQGKLRFKIAHRTDYRVKLMSEIVSGIQVIKMYAWEKSFEKVVALARKVEIDKITQASYIRGLYLGLTVFTERLCLYLTLITFVLLGNRLTGDIVFSMAQLFNTVQLYMAIYYPSGLSAYAEAKVSINRLEDFLLLEENENKTIENGKLNVNIEKPGKIKLEKLCASWVPNPITETLININLEIKPGTLCCVVGNVGSGKSSLLQVLLKELPITKGAMDITGKISYASQEPWLFVSSVRNNILFGRSYIKQRYSEVVKVCALERDFKQFPHKDKTLVGERGVSLSGGQRARINLARAVYSEADIYLLDDPLSAVDTHVGKHLFDECIMRYLRNKTRILVTHQLQFLRKADLIVVLGNGMIESIGTFNELGENELRHFSQQQNEDQHKEIIVNKESYLKKERMHSVASFASISSVLTEFEEPQETQELIEKGVIPTSTYTEYYRNGAGVPLLIVAALFLIIAQMASNAADFWVTYWTNMENIRQDSLNHFSTMLEKNDYNDSIFSESLTLDNFTDYKDENFLNIADTVQTSVLPPREWYIIIYSVFIAASIILTPLSRNLCYIIFMKASKTLHNKMFNNVLQAPMRFFDTNPSGRILNRFSKDMGTIDEVLPKATTEAIQVFLVMAGILLLVFIVSPWMIVPAVFLGFIFYVCEAIYLGSAQDIKRLEGVTRAPVFSHISASLYGLSTIRASKAERMIINEFDNLQDQHTATWYIMLASSETFGFYLDVVSTLFLSCVTFQFLIFKDENTLSANVGLVISQAMVLTGMLQLGPRATAEVASNMTSVERVLQYSKLEKEGPFDSLPAKKPPRDWPSKGKLTFRNTYLRYVPDEAPVLRNLSIEIQAAEKIGIVGRTGAGKSTMIASLFRLAPIEGLIAIDDVDTASIGLHDLRSNISIIPQEPVLFSATIRYNLDPFGKVTDKVIWDALEKVELKGAIDSLEMNVSEGGSNFSAGQRQLICLARAIVRNNKILVMDEATANVDHITDSLIQKTIRENFQKCTVLTIAHRLNTIMDSDKVLVLDGGVAVEFAHPHELLFNSDGYFSSMVKETGSNMEAVLRKIAQEEYEKKFGE